MRTIRSFAWLSILALPISSFGAIFQVVQLSEPAGFLSQTDAIHQGTNHPSVTPTLSSNGYAFGYWTIDGVRVAGPDGRSLTQVSSVIQAASTYKAYYFQESADSDSDGIMDWFEYRMFGALSRGPGDDPDGDGFTNQREDQLAQDPLVKDLVRDGGLSSRTSTAFVYADTSMVKATVKSDPAGFVTQSENFLALNSNVSTASLNGETTGYHFAYWSVNGVRQAAPNGTASSQVDMNVSVTSEIVAHYLPSNEDSDSDGVMDWFELHQFGNLTLGPNDDPDGDGFFNKLEGELGQEARIKDLVRDGGLSSRTSNAFVYADTSMVQATIKSDPAGFVTQTENFLALNSNISTASLNGETNGYHFAYWSVNGMRQTASNGISASQVDMNVSVNTQIVAHYLPSNEDTDSDGVMDWFELHQFGNLSLGPNDDPDGDGFSNKREGELGQEARVKDLVRDGGLSSRVSPSILYFLQVNNPPDGLDLNDTIVHANKPAGEQVGIFQPSDPDDPNGQNAYQLSFLEGNGSTDKNLFTISGRNLLSTSSLQVGSYSINVRVMDDENASFDKNFTIQAIHDPNKDDDNDGLTYAQEQALGTSDSNPDTDGDGFTDGQEVANGSSPTDPNSTNYPPSALNLSKTSVLEKLPVGTYVGTFGASDPDQGSNLTFSLASGTGSDHNHLFSIDANDSLLTAIELDHEQNSTLSIRAKVQDQLGASLEAVFQIRVGKDFTQSGLNGIGIDFVNKDYRSSDFSGIRTESYADFSGAVLRHANFAGGNKKGTKFIGANLSHADFTGADIKGTNFTNAEVNGTNFFGAAFNDATSWPSGFDPQTARAFGPGIDFRSFDLSGFSKIDGPLQNTNFEGTNLSGKRIEGSDLNGSNLRNANLSGGNKKNVKFTYVDLRGANLTGANISGATFTGAIYDTNTTWPTGFDPVAAGALSRNPPTDLNSTAPLSVAENQPVGTGVGVFHATDPDANATLTYTLVNGAAQNDNSLFTLDQNGTLKIATTFDYESNASSYTVRVQVTDEHNATIASDFTVSLTDDPTDNISQPVALTNANFQTAVNLWFTNQADAIATYGHIRDWNVSEVRIMNEAFKDRTNFNEDIGGWDVSKVMNMNSMFKGARQFNQNLSDWNVSAVKTMNSMFTEALAFNQPIGNWDTSEVKNMWSMFKNAESFNQYIGDWNVSGVTNFGFIFDGARSFNQDLGGWDVSSVTSTYAMFRGAQAFNQNIADWRLSSVTTMNSMFKDAKTFNQDIGAWDTSSVTDMWSMFSGARAFDQNISEWNSTSVIFMELMFKDTPALSSSNKEEIHTSFSSNSNWPYDWSDQSTQSDPGDSNATNPDDNATQPDVPTVELFQPIVETGEARKVQKGSAALRGSLIDNGGARITGRGFLLSPRPNPKLGRQNVIRLDVNGSKNFQAQATNLKPGKKYFYRAFATNAEGTSLGSVESFTTIAGPPSPSWINAQPGTAANWWTSPWFGNFYLNANGWARHEQLDWVFPIESPTAGLWLWKEGMGWLWTDKEIYPFLNKSSTGGWLYFYGQYNGTLLFYDYEAKGWIRKQDSQ